MSKIKQYLSLFVKAQNIVESFCVGFKGEGVPLRKPVEIRIRDSFYKFHVLAARLVQPRAFAQRLELNRRRRCETLLLAEIADGHSLHGLVCLHKQLSDLLENGRLYTEEVSVPFIGLVYAVLVVGLGFHCLYCCVLLVLFSFVHLNK